MTKTKMAVKALIVCGSLLIGSLAVAHLADDHSPAKRMEKRVEHMKSALNLTDAQVAQVREIYKKNETTMQSDFDAMKSAAKDSDAKKSAHEKMRADMQQIQSQVKEVLTPDQQAKWQDFMAKHQHDHEKDHDNVPQPAPGK
jgi:protein CpxP